jgi:hypothetical protein
MYRGIDAVSSRYARTLGGNRTVAEPLEFVVGEFVTGAALKQAGDSAGGLFSGTAGPKPPQAISKAVVGMKPGGRVSRGSRVAVGAGWAICWRRSASVYSSPLLSNLCIRHPLTPTHPIPSPALHPGRPGRAGLPQGQPGDPPRRRL